MSILLKDLLTEGTQMNRVNLMRVETILENLTPKLNTKEQQKLAEVYVELKELTEVLNQTPFNVFTKQDWHLLNMILVGKVAEFKLVAESIAEDNKQVDCWPLAKAIDLILIY